MAWACWVLSLGWAEPVHADLAGPLTYAIEVQLDPEQHTLSGFERIHFENTSTRPVTALYFHLYLNAFRDARSVFMREGGTQLRGRRPGRPGGIAISTLRTRAGEDLSPLLETELIPGDLTQARVRLASPLPPRAALDLELVFQAELPEIVARAGYAGEFHMLAQWFPKLAKLADDGSFASFPYHGFGEFYADFADFTLSVELPERYQVVCAGTRVDRRVEGGRRRERYHLPHALDLAWAAYPYFEHVSRRVAGVRLELSGPRGYGAALTRQAGVLSAALPFFARHYGPYPYDTLHVVLPPADALAAGGMEYPALFASSGPWWALPAALPDPFHDIVSVHELAHEWFAITVASDEVSYPMLDEGLAEWAALDFLQGYYARIAPWSARLQLPHGPFDVLRAAALMSHRKTPSSLLSADQYNDRTLAGAVYARPALALARLGERAGAARLRTAIGRYARAQRFRHPTPEQLFASLDASLGAGVGTRTLRKALGEPAIAALPLSAAASTPSPSGYQFLPELWSLLFALLRGLGP